jgi:hypothetical protein
MIQNRVTDWDDIYKEWEKQLDKGDVSTSDDYYYHGASSLLDFLKEKVPLKVITPEQRQEAAEKLYKVYRDSIFGKPDTALILVMGRCMTIGDAKLEGLNKFPYQMLDDDEQARWLALVGVVEECLR